MGIDGVGIMWVGIDSVGKWLGVILVGFDQVGFDPVGIERAGIDRVGLDSGGVWFGLELIGWELCAGWNWTVPDLTDSYIKFLNKIIKILITLKFYHWESNHC